METIHPGAWIFLLIASIAIIWSLARSTRAEELEEEVSRMEKLAIRSVVLVLAGLVGGAAVFFVRAAFATP